MLQKSFFSILLLFALWKPSSTQARYSYQNHHGTYFSTSFQFLDVSRESSNRGDFNDRDWYIDLKLGYGFSSGLYLGGVYSIFDDSDEDRFGYGPTLGYLYNGFFFGFSYLINAEHKIDPETQTLKKGSGYMIEVGYNYPLSSFMSIGANLSYYGLSYKESESYAGVTAPIDNHKESFIVPMFQIGFYFGSGDPYDSPF